jgi:hypothetical protein
LIAALLVGHLALPPANPSIVIAQQAVFRHAPDGRLLTHPFPIRSRSGVTVCLAGDAGMGIRGETASDEQLGCSAGETTYRLTPRPDADVLAYEITKKSPFLDDRLVFRGEVLVGTARLPLAFGIDGAFLGGTTSWPFELKSIDQIVVYVQQSSVDDRFFSLDDGKTPKSHVTITPSARLRASPVADWTLNRIGESRSHAADATLSLSINAKSGETQTVFASVTLPIWEAQRLGLYVGPAMGFAKESQYVALANGESPHASTGRPTFPAIWLSIFLHPRVIRDGDKRQPDSLPGIVLGLRANSLSKELMLGASVEPTRGIALLAGVSRSVRAEYSDALKKAVATGAAVPTVDRSVTGLFLGIGVDANLAKPVLTRLIDIFK